MNRQAEHVLGQRWTVVGNVADHVEQPAERGLADRNGHRASRRADGRATLKPRGRLERNPAYPALVQMSLDLQYTRARSRFDDERLFEPRKLGAIEGDIDHRPAHGNSLSLELSRRSHCRQCPKSKPRLLITAPVAAGWAMMHGTGRHSRYLAKGALITAV